MKFKTTQKAIKTNYNTIICIPYCGLQNLLNYKSPVAYTVRREGWAADIYDMGGGVAIVTGYAPFGNVRPSYELRERYETKPKKSAIFPVMRKSGTHCGNYNGHLLRR